MQYPDDVNYWKEIAERRLETNVKLEEQVEELQGIIADIADAFQEGQTSKEVYYIIRDIINRNSLWTN